jgi:glucose dehydrogenase
MRNVIGLLVFLYVAFACSGARGQVFAASGKQFVVIAAGSHPKISEESLGDALVAFTLP